MEPGGEVYKKIKAMSFLLGLPTVYFRGSLVVWQRGAPPSWSAEMGQAW